MTIPLYRPYFFLRCKKCGKKTVHVLVSITYTPSEKGEIEETYECQECGETKKVYELASMVHREYADASEELRPDFTYAEGSKGAQLKVKNIKISDRQKLMFILIVYMTFLVFLMSLFPSR